MTVPNFNTLDRVYLDGAELRYLGEADGGPLFARENGAEILSAEVILNSDLVQFLHQGRLIVIADGHKSRRRK